MRSLSLMLAATVLLVLGTSPALAQFPKRIKAKGTVVSVAPGKIQMKDEGKTLRTYNIIEGRNAVTVKGDMRTADLKPGMLVRVEGPMKGMAMDGEIAQVTVYSLTDGYEVGFEQEGKNQPVIVTGLIKILKDGTLTLQVGKKKVTAKLAAETKVTLDSKDYSIASAGSLIEADGYETKDGSVNAKTLVITLKPKGKSDETKVAAKTAKSTAKPKDTEVADDQADAPPAKQDKKK